MELHNEPPGYQNECNQSCYLKGRQAETSFRGIKSSTRIVRTGVPQGSKLSPSLLNYYIADMPTPTPQVKRVYYADDITVCASGPKIPELESMINSYLRDVGIYLKENSLLITAPKSTVSLFTPDKHQFHTHPDVTFQDAQLPLERDHGRSVLVATLLVNKISVKFTTILPPHQTTQYPSRDVMHVLEWRRRNRNQT